MMNRIKVVADEIQSYSIDDKQINYEFISSKSAFDINQLKIQVMANTDLYLEGDISSNRYKITLEVNDNIKCNLFTVWYGNNSKIKEIVTLNKKSKLNWERFNNTNSHKEMIIINLCGINALLDYNFKTICKDKSQYDLLVYHQAKKTISNLHNNIVTKDNGKVQIQVSSFIPKGMVQSIANQDNRIVSFDDNRNIIKPNLYIDEYDSIANHCALIGRFSDEEMFYLNSRGLPNNIALQLLIKGFLLNNITNNMLVDIIKNEIKQNWR